MRSCTNCESTNATWASFDASSRSKSLMPFSFVILTSLSFFPSHAHHKRWLETALAIADCDLLDALVRNVFGDVFVQRQHIMLILTCIFAGKVIIRGGYIWDESLKHIYDCGSIVYVFGTLVVIMDGNCKRKEWACCSTLCSPTSCTCYKVYWHFYGPVKRYGPFDFLSYTYEMSNIRVSLPLSHTNSPTCRLLLF